MREKIRIIAWTVFVYFRNMHAEWSNARLEKKRRTWTAYKVAGGGVVPLGKVDQERAIDKVSQYGSIVFVDTECAVIMFCDK